MRTKTSIFVSVSSGGSSLFWGRTLRQLDAPLIAFQYPLVDRVCFGVHGQPAWPTVDDEVSVSSGGSSLFWGPLPHPHHRQARQLFQYPLVDRVCFGVPLHNLAHLPSAQVSVSSGGSSLFWGSNRVTSAPRLPLSFSILWWIEFVLGSVTAVERLC